jgi:homoserine kinase type II
VLHMDENRVYTADEEQLAPVLSHYALGQLQAAQRIEQGFVNDNWVVETDRGRYFLKRRHPDLHEPEKANDTRMILAQHDLMKWLREADFPAPAIVPTVGGQTLLILNGDLYEIQGYIEGDPYDHDRSAHLEAAATMLGRYHARVKGFAPRALCTHGDLYSPTNASAALRLVTTRLHEACQPGEAPGLAAILQQLKSRAHDLATRFARHQTVPRLVIHGDYYAGNLLFQDDQIVGVVDYDKATWQPRIVEVAEALIYFASSRPGQLKHLVYPGFLEWKPLKRFLQGYACLVTLDENEVCALPDYIYCIWFGVSLRCTAQRLLEEGPRPAGVLAALQEVLALADWACANAGNMVEIARSTMYREDL